MSWIGSECQGDQRYECTYLDFYTDETWCRDQDFPCNSTDDHGGLWSVVDHDAPSGGGW